MRIASWRARGVNLLLCMIDRAPRWGTHTNRGRYSENNENKAASPVRPRVTVARVRSASVNIFTAPRLDRHVPWFPIGVSHRSSQQFSCTHRVETSRSQTYAGRTLSRRRSSSHPPHPPSLASIRSTNRLTSRFGGTCSRLAFDFAFAYNELTKSRVTVLRKEKKRQKIQEQCGRYSSYDINS